MKERDILEEKIQSLKNNSTELFVIQENYLIEDYYDVADVLFVVNTEKEAKQIVKDLNSIGKSLSKEQDKFYKFRNSYYRDNKILQEELSDIPAWLPGLSLNEITTEMRTKRRLLMERNQRISRRNEKALENREKAMHLAYKDFAKPNFTIEQILYSQPREFSYRKINKIEKVKNAKI